MIRILAVFVLASFAASAAKLVRLADSPSPNIARGFEPNRGQAKPEVLFLQRGVPNIAVTANAILFSPLGVQQSFVASSSDPALSFDDALPGVVNSFSGADASQWVTGIPRFGSATLEGVYPGIDIRFIVSGNFDFRLQLVVAPGADPNVVAFEFPEAFTTFLSREGDVSARFGSNFRFDPVLTYAAPVALQGVTERSAAYEVESETRFRLRVDSHDPTFPLAIEMRLIGGGAVAFAARGDAVDEFGSIYIAAAAPDPAGKDKPFPESRGAGCGFDIGGPVACTDVAVIKLTDTGEVAFVSYFSGATSEDPDFLGLAPNGSVIVAGTTDAADFPVTRQALQPTYGGAIAAATGGRSNPIRGDFFAMSLDPATGAPLASTYFGGPQGDTIGEAALGADGSLYFLHEWFGDRSAEMPVSPGALIHDCAGDPCFNSYAARISPSLDELIFGTYLPGVQQATAELHSDGSIYYAGRSGPDFVPTPGSFQPLPASEEDAIIARLDPSGTSLIFATYLGGPKTDWILRMEVSPDGSVWVGVSSFEQCCIDIDNRLIRFDPLGERVLIDLAVDVGDLATGPEGALIAIAGGPIRTGPDPFLAQSCTGIAYLRLTQDGMQLFGSYLPDDTHTDFDGISEGGLPILRSGAGGFVVDETAPADIFVGCVRDAAGFGLEQSPGGIVTLFGGKLGPREGVAFELEGGRVPTELAGTRVLVNGEPIPLLYSSDSQVNGIFPYSTPTPRADVRVEVDGEAGEAIRLFSLREAWVKLFRLEHTGEFFSPAAALNEDGTVNSRTNPARPGSRVVLFGTGGGQTVPPSVAGEVTPLELRPLERAPGFAVLGRRGEALAVEYAGAAPGLVAGVSQFNVKLPDPFPQVEGFEDDVLPLEVQMGDGPRPQATDHATVFVRRR